MASKGCSNFQWHIGDELHFSVAYREFTLLVLVLVWFPDEAMEHVPHALAPAPKGEGCIDE